MPLAADYPFLDVLWTMIVFFVWLSFIMLLFRLFGDVFHREDLSGWAKAGWTILLVFMPFLGALIYIVARPKMTAQDRRDLAELEQAQRSAAGYSAADEIAKLTELRKQGAISEEEFERLKARATA